MLSLVIVNFMCQFNWIKGCKDIWLNIISVCVCEVVSDVISLNL